MANDINLSSTIRTNLLSLQQTNSLFNRTAERLSTGLKVNSALDGADAFFSARGLNSRAADLSALKDGMGQGIQTVKAADKGLEALTKLVEQAKSIANQAKAAASSTFTKATGEAAVSTVTGTSFAVTGFTFASSAAHTLVVAVSGGQTVSLTITTTTTINSIVSELTAVDSSLTATWNDSTKKIELSGDAGTTVTLTTGVGEALTTLFGTNFTSGTAKTFGSTGSSGTTATLEADFEKVMTQINTLVADTSYKGINLLNGDNLSVTINETGSTLSISGSTLNVTGLGFTAATVDWNTAGNIDTSITEAEAAISKLRSTGSGFSADLGMLQTRESFTTDMIETLESGAGLLINANLEEESANLLALQTRQALGTSSLSFASQAEQSILQLFR